MSADSLVQSFVLCEEVRLEANGKHVIVGATGNGLAMAELPGRVALAFYLELRVPEMGERAFDLKVNTPSGELNLGLLVNRLEDTAEDVVTVFTPRFDVVIEKEGQIVVDIRTRDGDWQHLTTRPLILMSPQIA